LNAAVGATRLEGFYERPLTGWTVAREKIRRNFEQGEVAEKDVPRTRSVCCENPQAQRISHAGRWSGGAGIEHHGGWWGTTTRDATKTHRLKFHGLARRGIGGRTSKSRAPIGPEWAGFIIEVIHHQTGIFKSVHKKESDPGRVRLE